MTWLSHNIEMWWKCGKGEDCYGGKCLHIDIRVTAEELNMDEEVVSKDFTNKFKYDSYRKIQQDATVYQNLLFHIYMKLTCFGRHTAHHQEPKTALAASGLAYMEGCWMCGCWMLTSVQQLHVKTTFHIWKTRGCQCSFRLLMMGGVSPETRWASCKYRIVNFDTLLHLVGFFCMNCTMLHGSTNIKFEYGLALRPCTK